MFKKLRRRFVVIIMVISGIILSGLFTVVCVTNFVQMRRASYAMLKEIADTQILEDLINDNIFEPNIKEETFISVGTLKLTARYDVSNLLVIENVMEYLISIDEDELKTITNEVMLGDRNFGYVANRKYNFYKTDPDRAGKFIIVFSKCGYETALIIRLVTISFFSLLLGLSVIFFIAIKVSKKLVDPTEKAWYQQQQFIANASHELKTPLTVILANNNILLNHKQEKIEDKEKWITSTQVEAEQMKKLLEQMLYLAKSDAGILNKSKERFDISELVFAAVLQFDSVAFEKNINIVSSIEENLFIKADKEDVQRVVGILLDNAIKYSEKETEIFVYVKKIRSKVELSIKNYGNYIDNEDLPHIFERFYRSDKSRSNTVSGFGLGLAIAYNIVNNYGGELKCISSVDDGTVFTAMFSIDD